MHNNDNNYIEYLKHLINCPSVTPKSAGSIEYVQSLLEAHGFIIDVQVFGQDKYITTNLYAVYQGYKTNTDHLMNLCFAGHLDIVPPGDLDQWDHDPFSAIIKDDMIYGRGAVDMKGGIACMLAAALNFIKRYPAFNGSISFLLTTDEEKSGKYGMRSMLPYLKKQNINIDLVILGEPTNKHQIGDTIKIGRRGSINFTLNVNGTQGHVAYPDQADNPVTYMLNILHDLAHYKLDEGNEFFESSNLEITSIDVDNQVMNIIPQKISSKFNIRFNNIHSYDDLVDIVKNVIEKYTINYELNSNGSSDPFIQPVNESMNEFKKIVQKVTNIMPKLSTDGGVSDARFIKDYYSVIEFGLLSNMAHKINECTAIKDLQTLYSVYHKSLEKFLL